jgi:glutamate carboxypeptidase
VACDGGNHLTKGKAGWQPGGLVEGEELEHIGVGPGVLDMKGGLVVVAFAVRALAETVGLEAVAPLRIAIVADEEVGSPEGQGAIGEWIAGVPLVY